MQQITDTQRLGDDLAQQCRPKAQCLIGVEHEKFIFSRYDKHLLRYAGGAGIHALLAKWQRFGWQPSFEQDNLVGLKREGAAITLEPAGQLELSGSPWADLHAVYEEMLEHRLQLSELADEMGLGIMALGFAPQWNREAVDWMPKSRFHIMRGYMPKVGVHGLDMMTRTCSFQLNFDFCSEQDMCDKYRVTMALQSLVMVALANSPFADGRDSRLNSYRNYVWLHTDSARCGILPLVFSPELSFTTYVQRALEVPMYSVKRNGVHVDLAGRSFADMMQGALPELPGEKPTLKDWKDHLNTLMHDVRLKDHLELRGNDSLTLEHSMALAAFWTGILYDDQALSKALKFIEGCDVARLNQLRHRLSEVGMAESAEVSVEGVYPAESLLAALKYVTALAHEGLKRRQKVDVDGADEALYLQPLQDIIEQRLSPAERWRKLFKHQWQGDLSPLYRHAVF
ncbi:glutamate--cysteine ligase [Halomonas sp. ZH2S]|uniref:Glutamate--cysteine ligase n=1 Tax=Vreelandella zhuhanensis TaxID=2684210 RepID=A0A7X3GZM0_9GAMM|nr:glutamate-cysteine ligase family protein [Halomonas zhuhanensis]MWJ27474.1 glutamate--cysteine ligase [Halomonas zhuhanensis]